MMLPSKPRIVSEDDFVGVYEIDNLYPGYGHTLGNSLRRIILSSLPGAAITSIKIDGINHEFSTIEGVKEDVVTLILNLKKVRLQMTTDEPQKISLKVKGPADASAGDLDVPGQVKVLNPKLHLASVTAKGKELAVEMTVERGLGYMSKETLQKDRVEIGNISLDAAFTPIRRVNYEVENMRVGNRTDFNRMKLHIETDGTITPHEALSKSIEIMVNQLKAIIGFKEEVLEVAPEPVAVKEDMSEKKISKETDPEILKTRVETLDLSQRTMHALTAANIRTVGGLVRKREEDILDIDGLGNKGVQEIKKALSAINLSLRE
ncbi:MAG: DNA-directed RNA polymerase subunit alpha [Candidatus Taylorbacteria bacterium RIFCSPHIGHO2_01_FULL_46_22b]|uniref:DNA-directed RNA polymerase subunit alpha n=1 Tax=Candidatus Taylorbacteria bacterium RIFCSPHIGHO2_01_FULL_46_22b TaxID=1802301 RepID=A0A1G2M1Q1_9BACT|nr:MAG: DNA-directed RNA polymerase subunit alpha [Candidatus Taylorbacteria bacterium RIFCSPHIGHO2_01_FULL_46_22b]